MMKKLTFAALLGLGLVSGQALAAGWTGGDDQPTNPLACDGTPSAGTAMAYDGGAPTNPPDRKGKKITVVDVPKLIGIGYFNATSKGIADAATELGNVEAKTDGPTKANIDEQITFLDNYITSGVDGILFAANDPVAIAPVLKKALEKGINVVGYDANSTPDARQWFVNQAQFNGIAKSLVDSLAAEIGEEGRFAIVTSTFTTPNAMKPYVEKGCVKSVVLWNPVDLGYAAMQVLRAVADGTLQPGATSVKAGKLGELQVINGSEILLGAPYVFNKDNIGQFDF